MTDAPAEHQPPAPPPASTSPAASGFDVAPIVRKALSAVRKAVVLYRGGKLVYANTAAASLFGHDMKTLLPGGMTLRRRWPESRASLVESRLHQSVMTWLNLR
jgi:hypothetical protein